MRKMTVTQSIFFLSILLVMLSPTMFIRSLSIVPCSCPHEPILRPLSICARFEVISGRVKGLC